MSEKHATKSRFGHAALDPYKKRLPMGFSLVLLAILLAVAQITLATLVGRGDSWRGRYLSLCGFDGGWYADVIQHGYRTVPPPDARSTGQYNVAFFPAYPWIAKRIARWFGLSTGTALLVTSQIVTAVFWWIVLRSLHHWRVELNVSLATVMLIFCQPGAYYFVSSYSESLFLASLLLLLWFLPRAGHSLRAAFGASLAGYVMSATRIVGAPLAVLPAIFVWSCVRAARPSPHSRRIWSVCRYSVVAISTAAGTLSFFAYCAVRFGHWDEYMRARSHWAGVYTDLTALFRWDRLSVVLPTFYNGSISPFDVTRFYNPAITTLLLSVISVDLLLVRRGRAEGFIERLPYYFASGFIFYITVSTNVIPAMSVPPGMIRYSVCIVVPLILAAAHLYSHSSNKDQALPFWLVAAIFIACMVGLALQLQFCSAYARGTFLA